MNTISIIDILDINLGFCKEFHFEIESIMKLQVLRLGGLKENDIMGQ
jgi:hypothetical protein